MSKTEYIAPFMDTLNQSNQITHVCVPHISSNYINSTFIDNVKINFNINITVIPFNPLLFNDLHENNHACSTTQSYIKDGLYILIDSNDPYTIIKHIGKIQRHINIYLKEYKSKEYKSKDEITSWTCHYLDDKRHKWVAE
tara:strand:+ start:91 stop:510 length:420 start_codon:yes stop_codon:yes gene_type:complete